MSLDERFRQIVQENPAPFLIVSLQGKLVYANNASMPVLLFLGCEINENVNESFFTQLQEAEESGFAKCLEIQEAGLLIELTLTISSQRDCFFIFGRDITRIRELEKEAEKSARNDGILAMIATYAHEISNPLTIAIGLLSSKSKVLDETRVNKTLNALDRIAKIIEKIRKLEESDDNAELQNYSPETKMLKLK